MNPWFESREISFWRIGGSYGGVFSGDEILKMAVQTEELGFKFYRKAASVVRSPVRAICSISCRRGIASQGNLFRLKTSLPSRQRTTPWLDDLGSYIKAITDSSLLSEGNPRSNPWKWTMRRREFRKSIEFEKDTFCSSTRWGKSSKQRTTVIG